MTQCLDDIRIADKALADILPYATSPKWGYLTACPTNSGTGFRASLMVHLGALTITQNYKVAMMRALEDLDLNCRGYFGEVPSDCEPFLGPVYQISNRKASGETEEQVIQRITQIANDLTKRELDCRLRLLTTREGRANLRAHTLRHLALAVNSSMTSAIQRLTICSTSICLLNLDCSRISHSRTCVNSQRRARRTDFSDSANVVPPPVPAKP